VYQTGGYYDQVDGATAGDATAGELVAVAIIDELVLDDDEVVAAA
jgi:phospholipase C